LAAGEPVVVYKLKPDGAVQLSWAGEVVARAPGYVRIRAPWTRAALPLGYVTFEPGDVFIEHYYADRWYNVFAIYAPGGEHKGWYCNISRPAEIEPGRVRSVDLALDLWVWPDGRVRVLDEDEFARLALAPDERAAAEAARAELERLARECAGPFGD
jgi:hypothetical protein